jgi:hypothetical protein
MSSPAPVAQWTEQLPSKQLLFPSTIYSQNTVKREGNFHEAIAPRRMILPQCIYIYGKVPVKIWTPRIRPMRADFVRRFAFFGRGKISLYPFPHARMEVNRTQSVVFV